MLAPCPLFQSPVAQVTDCTVYGPELPEAKSAEELYTSMAQTVAEVAPVVNTEHSDPEVSQAKSRYGVSK
jgi:hypothetical protein